MSQLNMERGFKPMITSKGGNSTEQLRRMVHNTCMFALGIQGQNRSLCSHACRKSTIKLGSGSRACEAVGVHVNAYPCVCSP